MFQRLWLKLRGWGHAAGRFLLEQVLVDANRLRRVRRATLDEIEEANSPTREHLRPIAEGLTLDDLRRYVSSEDERRKSIEDKAKSNLVAITIGFPVLFAGLNFLVNNDARSIISGIWAIGALTLLILGVVYLIYGSLKALDALQVAPVYSPIPEVESFMAEEDRKTNVLWCLQQNERTTRLRTNALSVSNRSIRNGVMTLAGLILLLAGLILVANWGRERPLPNRVFFYHFLLADLPAQIR